MSDHFAECRNCYALIAEEDHAYWSVNDEPCCSDSCMDIVDEEAIDSEAAKRYDEEWEHEIAREEGMLGGIDSYNDYMGY